MSWEKNTIVIGDEKRAAARLASRSLVDLSQLLAWSHKNSFEFCSVVTVVMETLCDVCNGIDYKECMN